jgi:hypothetical protein
MQKTGLIFGVVSGVLLSAFLLLGMILWQEGIVTFDSGELFGYTTMLVALSAVFFGIKSYRDKHLNGTIRFGKALQLGLLISVVAAVMYAATWEVYRTTQPDEYGRFVKEYQQCEIDKAKNSGVPQAEVDAKVEQMATFMQMYENPLLRFGITMVEVLPVGILVSLVSAAILRRRQLAPS